MIEPTALFAGVLPFVRTAEERSFRKAATRLGVSVAAVSKAVARLEADLGVRLLERTSRHVSLTREGEVFLDRCRGAVAAVVGARDLMAQARRQPAGEVSLSVPFILAPKLAAGLAELGARYPRLLVRLGFSDRLARPGEGVDVAVRIGELEDSSVRARLLRRTRWATLASPSYLARHAAPTSPADLVAHNCIKFIGPNGRAREWTFRIGEHDKTEHVHGNLVVDRGEFLLDAASAGVGVCQVLDFMVDDAIREARVVEILPSFAAPGPPIHALALSSASPNTRAIFDLLIEALN